MTKKKVITSYHAPIYSPNMEARARASVFRKLIEKKFNIRMGCWCETPVGPHTQPMYQFAFETVQFPEIVRWLLLNRNGLTVLVHPETGQDYVDHRHNSFWLGELLTVNKDFLRSGQKSA